MKLSKDIKPITYMKTHSSDLVKEVNNNKRPIVITQNGVAKAVLIDIDSYENQQEILMMLKLVAQGEDDIKKKRVIEQDELFQRLDKKYSLGAKV